MRFKKEVRQGFENLDESLRASFKSAYKDIRGVERGAHNRIDSWARKFTRLEKRVNEMLEELATNGVVRDLRRLEKENKQLRQIIENVDQRLVNKFQELESNGVATAINKLNAEVFKDRKNKSYSNESGYDMTSLMITIAGGNREPEQEATLAGKVDAIVAHLGLDLTVEPEKKTKAKVVAKKVTTKKKGKK